MTTDDLTTTPRDENTIAVNEATPILKAIMWVILVLVVMLIPIFIPSVSKSTLVLIAYLLPIPLVVLLVLTVVLVWKGKGDIPFPALLVGLLFIHGGVGFDINATLSHSPDLGKEANPIARAFLDTGHGLVFTVVYGWVMSWVTALATGFWWAAFLSHYPTWLRTARTDRFWEYVRLLYGGGILSWRQLLIPFNFADLVAVYRACYYWSWINWTIVIVAVTMCHFYAGLEWFQLVPYIRPVYLMYLLWVVPAFLGLGLWLYREFGRQQKVTETTE